MLAELFEVVPAYRFGSAGEEELITDLTGLAVEVSAVGEFIEFSWFAFGADFGKTAMYGLETAEGAEATTGVDFETPGTLAEGLAGEVNTAVKGF